jgi:hypothetical protein
LKRYLFPVAAVLAFALGVTGGALAEGHPAKSDHAKRQAPVVAGGHYHSLIPGFAPHARRWVRALRELRRDSKAKHKAKHTPKHESRHTSKHVHAAKSHIAKRHATKRQVPKPKPTAQQQPHAKHRLRATTLSIYEQTAQPWILSRQGCSAARRHENGIVVLDFGKPAFHHGGYGTLLFSGRFAPNRKITRAMLGYTSGYVSCLPDGSTASIELARGTSNYHPSVPSAYSAGVRWARETNRLGRKLARKGLDAHVEAAAADDAEPAWDPSFRRTRDFFHGFRAAVHGHTLFDYGSLDGGVGEVWSARQAWFVAGGLPNTKALPEIYSTAMAQQWAELARISHHKYHRDVQFAGVMTQGDASCSCGLRPTAAHRVLAEALDAEGVDHVRLPVGGTNIVG